MYMLLKLDYAKFGVSNLLSSKVSKKPLGVRLDPPPLGKGKVKTRGLEILNFRE